MNEKRCGELTERLQERGQAVRELLEQLEGEKEKLDDAREELKTLPRPLVWEPLKGRIGLLEARVDSLMRDLARARLALFEEREAQARAAHERLAARATQIRRVEREAWRALQVVQDHAADGTGAWEDDAEGLAGLRDVYQRARALSLRSQEAEERARDRLKIAEQQRQDLEQTLGDLLR